MERIPLEENENRIETEPNFGHQNRKIEDSNNNDNAKKIEEVRQKIDALEHKPKKSSIRRIAGNLPEEKKRELLEKAGDIFANQSISKTEREKTPLERRILSLVNSETNKILEKYGLENFDIPPENVHIRFIEDWKKTKQAGIYNSSKQQILLQDKERSRSGFAMQTLHEKLHFTSYNSGQFLTNPEKTTDTYRIGLMIKTRDGEKIFFRNLNEAVTEEMTKKYGSKLLSHPIFDDEQMETKAIKTRYKNEPFFDDVYILQKMDYHPILNFIRRVFRVPGQKDIHFHGFAYSTERRILNALLNKLLTKNPGKFIDENEVMEMFERAMMTGNIIPIGRLIDTTFPKGTFRKIGELGEDTKELAKFVNEL